jgi:hypothetical protein
MIVELVEESTNIINLKISLQGDVLNGDVRGIFESLNYFYALITA